MGGLHGVIGTRGHHEVAHLELPRLAAAPDKDPETRLKDGKTARTWVALLAVAGAVVGGQEQLDSSVAVVHLRLSA